MDAEWRVTPERAKQILKKAGRDVDLQDVVQILDFLYKLADIVIENHLERCAKLASETDNEADMI